MKGYAILLLLVVCLVSIGNSDAWRRRRWRRIIRAVRKVYRYYRYYKTYRTLGKRDTEVAKTQPTADQRCQLSFLDKNNDNNISVEEMKSVLQNPDEFAEFDIDGNGHLDKEEFYISIGKLISTC